MFLICIQGAGCHSLLFSGKPEGELCLGVNTSPPSVSKPASPPAPPQPSSSSLLSMMLGGLWEVRQSPGCKGTRQGASGHGREAGGPSGPPCSSSSRFLFSGMPAHPAVRGPVLRADEREKAVNVFATEQDKQYPEPCFFLPAASLLRQATRCLPLFLGPQAPLLVFPFLSWPSRLAQLMG